MERDRDLDGGDVIEERRVRTDDLDDARHTDVEGPATAPVHTRGVAGGLVVREGRPDVGVREARARFGGIDVPASLVGMLTALSLVVLLAGLITAAVGAVGYQTGLEDTAVNGEALEDLTIAGLIGGLAILFVSFVVGGWAAARVARYDGIPNGVMAAVWAILLAGILSGLAAWLGDEYDVFRNAGLPQPFSREAVTAGAIITGVVAALTMLLAGALGGAWGERYHRRADETIAAVREGGLGGREVT